MLSEVRRALTLMLRFWPPLTASGTLLRLTVAARNGLRPWNNATLLFLKAALLGRCELAGVGLELSWMVLCLGLVNGKVH